MSLKVKYTHPDFPNDYEFEVVGLGLLKNGQAKTLSEEEEAAFVSMHGESVRDHFKDDESFKVEGTSEVKTSEVAKEGGEG